MTPPTPKLSVVCPAFDEEEVLLAPAPIGLGAGDLVKVFAPVIGARGGGRPDVAQGAGGDASRLPEALRAARAYLADHA